MKRSVLMAVAVMVGSMAMMTGCKSSQDDAAKDEGAAQETSAPAQTPAQDNAAAQTPAKSDESATVKASVGVNLGNTAPHYAPSAPPPPRFEPVRRPPSERHFWVGGHWSWTGRAWTWIGGRFEVRRDGRHFVAPRYEREHNRYRYVPGHWVRR